MSTTIVCFQSGDASYALAVDDTRGVEAAEGIAPLPSPLPGVVGLLRPADDALPVIAMGPDAAARAGGHVLVVESASARFGLLVDVVIGVVRVEDSALGPPPAGQADAVVRAVVRSPKANALLLDADVLAQRLVGDGGPR